jgi:uncharacterized protein
MDLSQTLHEACFAGNLSEVQRLLAAGADINAPDENGSGTLLTFDPRMIEFLLSQGADPDLQTNENGASVLAGLSYVNEVECVRVLLRHGANPNRGRDESGETPLHHALAKWESDRRQLVELLLDHGADPNARTTPEVISFNYWREAKTRGETPLHRAAAVASEETIKLLLASGGDPNIRDVNGEVPQGWASWHWRPKEIIDLLGS